jgi:hypothetical protein
MIRARTESERDAYREGLAAGWKAATHMSAQGHSTSEMLEGLNAMFGLLKDVDRDQERQASTS